MTVRAISIEAYDKHIATGRRESQWMRIYRYISEDDTTPRTRSELSAYIGIRLSSVCGRVNELIKANMIKELGRRKCRVTKEPAHTLTLKTHVDPNQRELL
jgi:predicted transcriptional regulator